MKFKTNKLFAAIATSAALLSAPALAASGTLEKVQKKWIFTMWCEYWFTWFFKP